MRLLLWHRRPSTSRRLKPSAPPWADPLLLPLTASGKINLVRAKSPGAARTLEAMLDAALDALYPNHKRPS